MAYQVMLHDDWRIQSPAIVTNRNHARTDGFVSLGVARRSARSASVGPSPPPPGAPRRAGRRRFDQAKERGVADRAWYGPRLCVLSLLYLPWFQLLEEPRCRGAVRIDLGDQDSAAEIQPRR